MGDILYLEISITCFGVLKSKDLFSNDSCIAQYNRVRSVFRRQPLFWMPYFASSVLKYSSEKLLTLKKFNDKCNNLFISLTSLFILVWWQWNAISATKIVYKTYVFFVKLLYALEPWWNKCKAWSVFFFKSSFCKLRVVKKSNLSKLLRANSMRYIWLAQF